jgi:hypothetical protein
MILHLSPGSGSIELHIHDEAQVALYQPGDRTALTQADATPVSRPAPRMFMVALTGVVCLALGYGLAARGSSAPARTPAEIPLARSLAPLPSNIPLAPDGAALPRYEGPVAMPRPRAEAEPADGVPAALTQQLAQVPVVVPPSAPAHPAAGSSAFGLAN